MANEELNPYVSSETTEIPLADQLIAEQNLFGTILGSIVGAIPGFIIYLVLIPYPFYAVIAYFLPGVFVGFFASFMGRGIDKIHRIIAAAITFLFLLVMFFWFELSGPGFGLSFINCVVAGFTANRWLSRGQEDALFEYKIGLKREKI